MPSKLVDREILKKFREKLDDKYVIEGEYSPETSVGISDLTKGIQSDREIDDSDDACPPITFGPAGGTAEIQNGYQDFEELRGQSYALNQLVQNGNFVDISAWYAGSCSYTVSGNVATITPSAIHSTFRQTPTSINGHKYLYSFDIKYTNGEQYYLNVFNAISQSNTGTGNWEHKTGIITPTNTNNQFNIYDYDSNLRSTWYLKNVVLFDLTLIYGAGNEPTTVLEFNRLFPLSYYAYNQGALISSQSNGLESIGMNQFDGVLEQGKIDNTGVETSSTSSVRAKNYIKVIPGITYLIENYNLLNNYICEYDESKTFIQRIWASSGTITLTNNTHYVRVYFEPTSGTLTPSQVGNVMFRLYYDTPNLPYQPYEKQTIVLPNVELRSAGSVYDSLDNKGLLTRRVGVVDLGTLSWEYAGASIFYVSFTSTKSVADSVLANIMCDKYVSVKRNDLVDKSVCVSATDLIIQDTTYTNATTFKNAMSGVYLYYELATPTEEQTSDTFNGLVKVDNYGTLNFTSEQTIQCPQAYFIRYVVNLVEFLDTAYVKADGDANNLVVASELSAYDVIDAQLKDAIGGTLRQLLASSQSIDFLNTKVVDLGTLTWTRITSTQTPLFQANIPDLKGVSANVVVNAISTKYKSDTHNNVFYSSSANMNMCAFTNHYLYIADNSYSDADTFKNAMKGVLLAYEKA